MGSPALPVCGLSASKAQHGAAHEVLACVHDRVSMADMLQNAHPWHAQPGILHHLPKACLPPCHTSATPCRRHARPWRRGILYSRSAYCELHARARIRCHPHPHSHSLSPPLTSPPPPSPHSLLPPPPTHTVDVSEQERVLRAFDLTLAFGPCMGLTRMERWVRECVWGGGGGEGVEGKAVEHSAIALLLFFGREREEHRVHAPRP